MKADIWRYCVIYKNGGLYTDLDTTCVIPIERWLPPDAEFTLVVKIELNCFNGHFMQSRTLYSKKNDRIIKN